MSLNTKLMSLNHRFVTIVFKSYYWLNHLSPQKQRIISKMKRLPKEGDGKDLFIVLNGPSLKTQDLTKLKGKVVMCVNKGFKHPLYKEIAPKYHIIVDPNLRDGIWPIEWLEEIRALSPGVRIILPIEWYSCPVFKNIKDEEYIYWLYWRVPFYNMGVSGGCFSFGIKQGFHNIFFTGFDGNSCACDMMKGSETHFYGVDPEHKDMTTKEHALALFSTFLQFTDLNCFSDYCKLRGINIINLTNGGLLDMFPRKSFDNPYEINIANN